MISAHGQEMKTKEGYGFTIDHPLLTVLILSVVMSVAEYILAFLGFSGSGDNLFSRLAGAIALIWGLACLCILVRSALWRLLRSR